MEHKIKLKHLNNWDGGGGGGGGGGRREGGRL